MRETELGLAQVHDGLFPGYVTSVAWFPEQGLAVAVQVNTDDLRALGGPPIDVLLLGAAKLAAESLVPAAG